MRSAGARLASWVPQKELVLERNSGHWDAGSVKLQKAIFLPTEAAAKQEVAPRPVKLVRAKQ